MPRSRPPLAPLALIAVATTAAVWLLVARSSSERESVSVSTPSAPAEGEPASAVLAAADGSAPASRTATPPAARPPDVVPAPPASPSDDAADEPESFTIFGRLRDPAGRALGPFKERVLLFASAADGDSYEGDVARDGTYSVDVPCRGRTELYARNFGWHLAPTSVLLDREPEVELDLVLVPQQVVLCRLVDVANRPIGNTSGQDPHVRSFYVAPLPLPEPWTEPSSWWGYNVNQSQRVDTLLALEDRARGAICRVALEPGTAEALGLYHGQSLVSRAELYAGSDEVRFVVEQTAEALVGTVRLRFFDGDEPLEDGRLYLGGPIVEPSEGVWTVADRPAGPLEAAFWGDAGLARISFEVVAGETRDVDVHLDPRRIAGHMERADGSPAGEASALILDRPVGDAATPMMFGMGTEADGSFDWSLAADVYHFEIELDGELAFEHFDVTERDRTDLRIRLGPAVQVTLEPGPELVGARFAVRTAAGARVLRTVFHSERYPLRVPPGRYVLELFDDDGAVRSTRELEVGTTPLALPVGE